MHKREWSVGPAFLLQDAREILRTVPQSPGSCLLGRLVPPPGHTPIYSHQMSQTQHWQDSKEKGVYLSPPASPVNTVSYSKIYTFLELLCDVIFCEEGSRVQTKTSSKHEGKWGRPGGSVGGPLYSLASCCSKTPASTQDSPSDGDLKQGVTGPSPESSESQSPSHNGPQGLLPAS